MKISLLLLCVLLGGVIYYQAAYYPRTSANAEIVAPAIDAANVEQKVPVKAKPLRAYAEIIKRPLFTESRRPPAVSSAQIEDTIDIGELENLILFGVVISGATKYAIVGNRKEESTEQIKEGHRYKGWRVSAISSDSIQFVGKDAQYELFISPNDTTKKSGIRNKKKKAKTPARQSIFRSLQKRNKSPISIPTARKSPPPPIEDDEEFDPALLEELGEEGGYEFDLDAEFDEEDLQE